MQLFALDEANRIILADQAIRQKNYICRECRQPVRVRRGLHKRAHFFHNEPLRICSQHGKGIEHLQAQLLIKTHLGDQCFLERHFSEIGRIADVCWEKEKIIFEVQCSPISLQEVKARINDYTNLGYAVVWILHDRYYGQQLMRTAEEWLHGRLCYFTNINKEGQGHIYDRCAWTNQGTRTAFGPMLPIQISRPIGQPKPTGNLPEILHKRLHQTALCFEGDLFHADTSLLEAAYTAEKRHQRHLWWLNCQKNLHYYFIRSYEAVLRLMLEKYCA